MTFLISYVHSTQTSDKNIDIMRKWTFEGEEMHKEESAFAWNI